MQDKVKQNICHLGPESDLTSLAPMIYYLITGKKMIPHCNHIYYQNLQEMATISSEKDRDALKAISMIFLEVVKNGKKRITIEELFGSVKDR